MSVKASNDEPIGESQEQNIAEISIFSRSCKWPRVLGFAIVNDEKPTIDWAHRNAFLAW